MEVNTVNFQNNNKYVKNIYPCPAFKMKMNELRGIDQFVARKYKINPQPIKTLQAFQEKCKSFVEDIAKKAEEGNFGGRQQETRVQRKAMIKDWYDYLTKENGAYTSAMALMILGGITASLKTKEDTLPPVLNKGILANTVDEIDSTISENPDENAVSFDKKYRLNLQKGIFNEGNVLDDNLNGWIVIPSKEHDPENFEANVDKLKMLSHDNWCTKSFNARPYLAKGDFHVYMEGGKPKLGVRFEGDEIQEIQGELNNSKIPLKYGDIAKEHIKEYKLTDKAKNELTALEKTKVRMKEIQNEFPNGINNYPVEEIFEKIGIECKKDKDGFLTISHYDTMNDGILFSDLGIDENRLIKNVKRIEGDAKFWGSHITSLGKLESIGGYTGFWGSKITNLGNLISIGGSASFEDSEITSLGNLESIGGGASFRKSKITSLGNLKSIGGDANFWYSQITSLGDLENIGGDASFNHSSQITSLGKLKSIGGNASFRDSQITSLGNLESIGGNAGFEDSQITSLSKLKSIGGSANFKKSEITSLGNLETIGGNAYFQDSQVTNLGNLKSIGGNVRFSDSQITNLGNLESIGGYASFRDSQITSLDNLKSIGGDAYFGDSQITSLGNLKSIDGNAYFWNSKITNLGNLESIGVRANIKNSKLTPKDFDSVKIGSEIIS